METHTTLNFTMKKLHLFILFTIFFSSFQTCFGQTVRELEKSYRDCLESGIPTTQSSLNCTYAYVVKYESVMVKTLNQLTEKLPNTLAEKLFENQTEWKNYMKSEIAFYQLFYNKVYQNGSQVRSAVLYKQMELLKKRILVLQERIDWLN